MSIKIKMLKNLISVLCAATIATSGVVTSVSATKTTGNTSSTSKTKKEEVKLKYDKAKENYENFSKVADVLDKIKNSKAIRRSADDIAVEFVKLCDICDKIERSVNGDEISEDKVVEAIGKLDRFNKRVTTLQNRIENMLSKQETENMLSEQESEQAKPKSPQKPQTERQKRLQDVARRQELVQTKRQRDIENVCRKVGDKYTEIAQIMRRNLFEVDSDVALKMAFIGNTLQALKDEYKITDKYKVLYEGKITYDAHKEFIDRANKLMQTLDRFKRKYNIDKLVQNERTRMKNGGIDLFIDTLSKGVKRKVMNKIAKTAEMKKVTEFTDTLSKGVKRKVMDKIAMNVTLKELTNLLKKQEQLEKAAIGKGLEKLTSVTNEIKNRNKRNVMNEWYSRYTDEVNEEKAQKLAEIDDSIKKAREERTLAKTPLFTAILSKAVKSNVKRNVMNKIAMNAALKEKQKEFEALYSNFEKVAKDFLPWAEKQDNIYHDVYSKYVGLNSVKRALKNDYTRVSKRLKGAKTLTELNNIVEKYKQSVGVKINNMKSFRKDYEKEKSDIGQGLEALKNGINKLNKINVMNELHSLYEEEKAKAKAKELEEEAAKQLAEERRRNEEIEKQRKADAEKARIEKEQKEQKQKFNNAKKEVKDKFNKITLGDDYLSLTLITNDEVSEIEKMKKKIENELKSLKDPAKDMDKVSGLNNEVEDFGRAVKELAEKLAAEEKKKPVTKMTKEKFEELLAGDQGIGNFRRIAEDTWATVANTCGVYMLNTLKNVYDYMDGKTDGFVQGFDNVIDNYLAKGGNIENLYAPIEPGLVGQALPVTDFNGFLENNNIGMSELEFYEVRNFREEAKQAGKSEQKLYKDYFNTLRNKVKSFLVKYMKGKEFAPIAILVDGHWSLLAQYDEKTDKVLILDSFPKEAKWVRVDTIAKQVIYKSTYSTGVSEFNIEMPIFTRTKGIKSMKVDSAEEFTDQKQDELINSIG